MHLIRIELTNFRQHKKLDVDFSGNLIAVLGPNGCGKSNLIGAIQYALTGEQPGFTKADLTTWGEKDGSVRLIFTAGPRNEEFVLTRKTNGDAVLKVGEETIKQARKVEEALREKAGLDKELIRQIVFVPQKGIDAILFDDPKNREVAFQRLIGIGNASKIYDALRTEIAAYDKPQGFDEAIARSRQQLTEQENVAQTCKAALTRYEDALKTLPTKEQLEQESAQLASASVCVSEYLRVDANLAQTQTRHEEKMKELAGLGAVSEEEEEKLRTRLDDVKDLLKFLQRLNELADAAYQTREEASAAREKSEDIFRKHTSKLEDDRAEMERLGAEQVAAESEVRSLRNLEKEASSDGTCPLCGASASEEDIHQHLSERIAAAATRASEATEKAKTARMAYDAREAEESAARRELDRKQSAYDVAFGALKDAKDKNVAGVVIDLETLDVSYKGHQTAEIETLTQEQSELTEKLNAAIREKQNAKSVRDAVAKLAAEVDLLVQKKKDCAERLISLKIDPNTVKDDLQASCDAASKKARANLDAYNGILRDMAAEKGRLESTEKTIADTRTFIADLVAKKEIEGKVKEKVDTLKRVRDWFHYKEGPRIMSQNVMKDLTACVNSYLDQFCAPFVVDAEEEGFGFRCRFIDGRTMPDPHPDASLLSGGQKVALAIAFRMAIYMCFGGELGLLSLDEPTAYLDDASIEHLGELLEKVGAVARNKGLQILMATHEKAIMPFLDTKIDLGALKETQKED